MGTLKNRPMRKCPISWKNTITVSIPRNGTVQMKSVYKKDTRASRHRPGCTTEDPSACRPHGY